MLHGLDAFVGFEGMNRQPGTILTIRPDYQGHRRALGPEPGTV